MVVVVSNMGYARRREETPLKTTQSFFKKTLSMISLAPKRVNSYNISTHIWYKTYLKGNTIHDRY
ncbi:hypothetical protein ROZALSC1DRAFT_30420, partial [Rozella allomycis CSF55]